MLRRRRISAATSFTAAAALAVALGPGSPASPCETVSRLPPMPAAPPGTDAGPCAPSPHALASNESRMAPCRAPAPAPAAPMLLLGPAVAPWSRCRPGGGACAGAPASAAPRSLSASLLLCASCSVLEELMGGTCHSTTPLLAYAGIAFACALGA